jgi:hypothetical protein
MKLTEKQAQARQVLLVDYIKALEATRKQHLQVLEGASVSAEAVDKAWSASFTLRYMMETHKKYISFLRLLESHNNQQALAVLAKLFDKLTISPRENLQGFINQAQQLLQSEEFRADIAKLQRSYERDGHRSGAIHGTAWVFATLIIPMLFVGLLFGLAPPLGVMLGLSIAFVLLVITASVVASDSKQTRDIAYQKAKRLNSGIDELAVKEPSEYSLTEDYSFETSLTSDSGGISINKSTVERTHRPQSISTLRANFFKPVDGGEGSPSLASDVESQFNLLTPASAA